MAVQGPVVIVGASVAGLRTAERLRGHGYDGTVVLIGAEPHVPYERPPLSKQLLAGKSQPEDLQLRDPATLAGLDLDLRLGVRATRLDAATRTVSLDDGAEVPFGSLVVATGMTPRQLPSGICPPDTDGVITLRTLDDALALRTRLVAGSRLVVVGGGLIGCEVAATATSLGVNVTVVEADSAPMARALGPELGAVLTELHEGHGVVLRAGRTVAQVVTDAGPVTGVRLADGECIAADTVLVSVGAAPATGWLDGSGLDTSDGVECDALGRTALADVYAVGDVARWHRPLYGRSLRIEHWTNATEQADVVAAVLAGADTPPPSAPYAWSDQYDVRIQIAGLPALGQVVDVDRADTGRQVTATYTDGDRLVAALGMNAPRHVLQARRQLLLTPEPAGASPLLGRK